MLNYLNLSPFIRQIIVKLHVNHFCDAFAFFLKLETPVLILCNFKSDQYIISLFVFHEEKKVS